MSGILNKSAIRESPRIHYFVYTKYTLILHKNVAIIAEYIYILQNVNSASYLWNHIKEISKVYILLFVIRIYNTIDTTKYYIVIFDQQILFLWDIVSIYAIGCVSIFEYLCFWQTAKKLQKIMQHARKKNVAWISHAYKT